MPIEGAPPPHVLAAFGVSGAVRPLAGGQTTAWLADGVVLKPAGDPAFHEWLGTTLAALPRHGFRLADAVPTIEGRWVYDGWAATVWVKGSPPDPDGPARWREILGAGRAFHRTTARVPKPDFLESRTDWWAVADRLAWADDVPGVIDELAAVADRLRAALAPIGEPQLVHADLTGNVLLADDLPPAIIDVSPYWRPASYAEGIVVADALCWHGASASLVAELGVAVPAVARALLFRLLTTEQRALDGVDRDALDGHARRYERAADLLGL